MRQLKRAIELGALGVLVRCRCLNVGRFSQQRALRLFGGDTEIKDIVKRVRCSRCGARPYHAVADRKRLSRGGGPPEPIVPKEWGRLP
ncbi:MAG: hypothetical protein K2X34_07515 [Hyphomonadaceae bacterium]|nr:hypothetical protein [Hyphomonadaceae bacterium]